MEPLQSLETDAAKVAFRLNPVQLEKMGDLWMREEKGLPRTVARCLPTCLPLLTEQEAPSQFMDQRPTYRSGLP